MSNSDEYFNRTAKNPWNEIFMHNDNDGPKNEDYNISSSLKTIWSDDYSRHNDEQGHHPQATEYVQFGNNVIAIAPGFQSKPARALGTGSYYNTVTNNMNSDSLKGRAITSRNGGYITHFGNENENQPHHSSVLSDLLPNQKSQPLEAFLQKVQVIVKNGFLDPKILHEPISPDTFDLIQMLIFYVMEYGRAKTQSSQCEMDNTFYKINLIQNEITKCQMHYIQQKRVQQEILQSFSTLETKQQNFTTGYPLSYQHGQSNVNNLCRNAPKTDTPMQRFGQRQSDQFVAQQPKATTSGNFTFLPKAKNIDKRSQRYEPIRYYSQRDGYFPTN